MKYALAFAAIWRVQSLLAATLYVGTNGLDSNPGTQVSPWLTIQKGASNAAAGDTVLIGQGEYSEWITNMQSGAYGSPITFAGTRGSFGEWLTIIDPSISASNGWVTAPEAGAGIWKKAGMPFAVRELTIDHKRVGFVYTNGEMSEAIQNAYHNSGGTTGFDVMSWPSDYVVTNAASNSTNTFWDGIEALYCSTGSVVYLRLRDGSDPNGRNIRAAPNREEYVNNDMFYPAIHMVGITHVVWSNVLVRGAWGSFLLSGGGNHTIVSNSLASGYSRVSVDLSSNNVIAHNTLTADYYGYSNMGAWQQIITYTNVIRENLYALSKFLMGNGSTYDESVRITGKSSSNVVIGNTISQGLGSGVNLGGTVTDPSWGILIASNSIDHVIGEGIIISEGHTATSILGNHLRDCNIAMRLHHMDSAGETNRTVYIYRNKVWLPDGCGQHFFVHMSSAVTRDFWPTFWIYHNSFSGGECLFYPSGYADDNWGMTNTFFLNNIASSAQYVNAESANWPFWTTNMVGSFDYNLVTPPTVTYLSSTNPVWFGSHNIKAASSEWASTEAMTFTLNAGSSAINSALDVSQTFLLSGTSHAALPVSTETMIGPAWDMGALEFNGASILSATTARAQRIIGR